MGLIARTFEIAGISTVTLINFRPHAECVRPPRAVFVNFPYGAQWGPPQARDMQRRLVEDALRVLVTATTPGTIVDLPYRWVDARRGRVPERHDAASSGDAFMASKEKPSGGSLI